MSVARTSYGSNIEVEKKGPWLRILAELAQEDHEFPAKIDKILFAAAQKGAAKASAKILAAPTGSSKRHTRARISRGVGVRRAGGRSKQFRGYRITTKMPLGEEMLPRGFASEWVHPVFGHPIFVLQQVHYDWFIGPIGEEKASTTEDILRAMEDQVDKIARFA